MVGAGGGGRQLVGSKLLSTSMGRSRNDGVMVYVSERVIVDLVEMELWTIRLDDSSLSSVW